MLLHHRREKKNVKYLDSPGQGLKRHQENKKGNSQNKESIKKM